MPRSSSRGVGNLAVMCGIIAILSRRPSRGIPTAEELIALADEAVAARPQVDDVAEAVERLDALLHGLRGVQALVGRRGLVTALMSRLDRLDAFVAEADAALEADEHISVDELERRSGALIRLRDALWAVRQDRFRTAREVEALAGLGAGESTLAGYLAIQQSFSAIDRLEVRGRDSAGIHVFVWGHGIDASDPTLAPLVADRSGDPLFQSGSLRLLPGVLSVVYKAAAEIGELGDNTRAMRTAVAADDVLRLALSSPHAQVAVLGHTRWASVGIISEPNAHPVNSEEAETGAADVVGPYVVAALNGDVDNHADLKAEHALRFHGPITTDAKVIPALVSRRAASRDLVDAFRATVDEFEGSVAIGAASADAPGTLLLAQRGSGQGLYVGLAPDTFIVASEPYGVVEETARYVRVDGEHGGEVFVLDAAHAGEVAGLRRIGYDGTEKQVTDDDLSTAEVTTRDIDRGDSPHFLLKEIEEAPESLRKTVRGKIVETDGRLHAVVGARALPPAVVERLASGSITKIRVIGQGTAAIAGRSAAAVLDELCAGRLDVDPITATELSGFGMRIDMSDTLVIAVSQSGTTTDTNRTVDLVRGRGAAVLAIVNRRNSDLTEKADGVLYTSDGRDVEMSVASTKAFYAQVAAGVLLACAVSEAAGLGDDERRSALLASLRSLPEALRGVLASRDSIAEAARRFAPHKRYWAVVGNGPNAIAAHEVRIKLSELCYKSIACDITEDKKHIDLSSEPLILVCAAGLEGSTASDVAKEVAIYRAHKATPIVVVTDGDDRFSAAAHVIPVPAVDPVLAFVLSSMAGHLFGYEAALAIDALARPLREAREVIELTVGAGAGGAGDAALEHIRSAIGSHADHFLDTLRTGAYDGHLEASTAVGLVSMLRSVLSEAPVEEYQTESGKVGSPAAVIDDLTAALTRAIEELTRPIDAIKHQAKTVTVGISRSDEAVLDRHLVQELLAAGGGRDMFSYRTLKVLADLDPAVESVTGYTRYRIDMHTDGGATIAVVDRGGLSRQVPSRVDTDATLKGTKRRVASEREVLVARGRSDGRTVILVPEVKSGTTVGLTLLHVRLHDRLPAAVARGVLQGYDRRYDRLVDWVSETEGSFRDDRLAEVPVADLLIAPISETADLWRAG